MLKVEARTVLIFTENCTMLAVVDDSRDDVRGFNFYTVHEVDMDPSSIVGVGVRMCYPRKFLRLCVQNPELWCILGQNRGTKIIFIIWQTYAAAPRPAPPMLEVIVKPQCKPLTENF